MDKTLDLLTKLSPLGYLALIWTILNYFLQRKHRLSEKHNDEMRIVLLELLDITNEISAHFNESMFQTIKSIYQHRTDLETIKSDLDITQLKDNINIGNLDEGKMEILIDQLKNKYAIEELNTRFNGLLNQENKLDKLDQEIKNLRQPSQEFIAKLESNLQKLNLAKISIIENQSDIEAILENLKKSIKKYILTSIKENYIINSELVNVVTFAGTLSKVVSKRMKQL